ncbi:M24 family metallopeptidase [Maridesulfovibrio salexigens]|uniref:Peptidase M24 n=1 Tax=Maridesulfovibrio salexigens (strain ATCC 14822 / DSM 2638 / NCIMB 8403 / VKM B-1763) TaxID=526222 RepID=C6C1Y0_MARSD|nr:Xaa-Pro peptidase family protein [Maridesulfovibrio salexigens]ACS79376.1 peptidase M24 [Maridesulfovibrio salexigens DSM 2638]
MSDLESNVVVPRSELEARWAKCRRFLPEVAPQAGGMLCFSRLQIYYLSGSFVNGAVWLPLEGEPVLFVRKSCDRANIESSIKNIVSFRSFKDLAPLAKELGQPLTEVMGAETAGLTWQLGEMLTSRMSEYKFVPGDMVLALSRAVKSEWELEIMREVGHLHHTALFEVLPELIETGMSELEIAKYLWNIFFELGHEGHMRMQTFNEEIFLGHISAGDSGIYPSSFNGPLGLRGVHPVSPFMGSGDKFWEKGTPLSVDCGFVMEGYHTDKTQVYWSGPKSSIPKEVLDAQYFCQDMQAMAADLLYPGNIVSDVYAKVMEQAEKEGFTEGFMGIGECKVPFIGHGIGLTVDGFPPIAKGFDIPIEEGMVFALEPKQGIPGIGMVGVENTFEVTADGAECLTGDDYDIICIE